MICDPPESLEQDESAELAKTTVAASKRTGWPSCTEMYSVFSTTEDLCAFGRRE